MDLVRSNIHALADRAGDWSHGAAAPRIEELSDEELEAELKRRKLQREAATRAAADARQRPKTSNSAQQGPRTRAHGQTRGARGASSRGQDPAKLARLYAQLECPYGADLTSVRKHYRRLMRKYHPDLHAGDPERQRLATELAQRLTSAYNDLRSALPER